MTKRDATTDSITARVEAGDIEGTLAALVDMGPAGRAELRTFAREIAARFPFSWAKEASTYEGRPRTADADASIHVRRRRATVCVVVAGGDPRDILAATDQTATFLRAVRDLRPDCAPSLASTLVANGARDRIALARALVAGGLSDRPSGDDYVLAFFGRELAAGLDHDWKRGLRVALLEDPDHLLVDVEQLFATEGTSERSLATHDRYAGGAGAEEKRRVPLRYATALLELTQQGVLPRDRVIDMTLAALGREWPAFRSGWFSRFHDSLEPSTDEVAQRAAAYRALLGSTIPATAAMAVEALARLDGSSVRDRAKLVDDLVPVMTARAKSTSLTALRLLARLADADPPLATRITHVAAQGLAHAASEVQRAALDVLQAHGARDDDALRALCEERIGLVAASLRKRAATWTAGAAPPSATSPSASKPTQPTPSASRAQGGAHADTTTGPTAHDALVPIDDPDDLAHRLAGVLEREDATVELDLVLDGIARLGADDRFRAGLGALRKRASKALDRNGGGGRVRFEIARLVLALADGKLPRDGDWRQKGPKRRPFLDALDLLSIAIEETAAYALARSRPGLPRLSAPTEAPAFVDPRELVRRAIAYASKRAKPGPRDAEVALLRLPPRDARRDEARALATIEAAALQTPFGVALRYALGASDALPDDLGLRLAASRARDPDVDDPLLAADHALGPGAGVVARHTWRMARHQGEKFSYPSLKFERNPSMAKRQTTDPAPDLPLVLALHRGQTGSTFAQDHERYRNLASEGTVRWLMLAWPRHLDLVCIEGAAALTGNLEFGSAYHHHRDYIEPLLWPTTKWTEPEPALVLLAVALAAKSADESGLAVDVVVHAGEAGRLDPLVLGAVMARMRSTGVILLARWAKSLASAARASAHSRQLVMRILERTLAPADEETTARKSSPGELPRNLAKLLDLLHELRSEAPPGPLPAATRAWIAALPDAGKLEKLKRDLLGERSTAHQRSVSAPRGVAFTSTGPPAKRRTSTKSRETRLRKKG